MSEFYLGQIMMTGFGFAQRGFAQCNGQLLSIQQNTALFSLIGTYYGGNGVSTFQLPNLQGTTPVGQGPSSDSAWQPTPYVLGELGGVEQVTLLQTNLPSHNHGSMATTVAATGKAYTGALFATTVVPPSGSEKIYVAPSAGQATPLYPQTVGPNGNNLPHANMQPFRVINYNIALTGVFPSRN